MAKNRMAMKGKTALMRVYTDERAMARLFIRRMVERARKAPLAGATVLRAVVGFGQSGRVQRASILDLSGNLPLSIELVDEVENLPELEGMENIGRVTLEEIEVLHDGSDSVRR